MGLAKPHGSHSTAQTVNTMRKSLSEAVEELWPDTTPDAIQFYFQFVQLLLLLSLGLYRICFFPNPAGAGFLMTNPAGVGARAGFHRNNLA